MIDGEEQIVIRAIQGEASAFGLLYDHYQPKIYRFVLVKVSRREEAEDLTHQVFLSAWQNISRYEQRGFPFSSWLYQIARNQVIDFYRVKKGDIGLDTIDPETFESEDKLGMQTELKLEFARVTQAIQKLKPDYQDVIILRFIEDLPIKEVAAAMDKSEGAIKLLQHRAIKHLKNTLEA